MGTQLVDALCHSRRHAACCPTCEVNWHTPAPGSNSSLAFNLAAIALKELSENDILSVFHHGISGTCSVSWTAFGLAQATIAAAAHVSHVEVCAPWDVISWAQRMFFTPALAFKTKGFMSLLDLRCRLGVSPNYPFKLFFVYVDIDTSLSYKMECSFGDPKATRLKKVPATADTFGQNFGHSRYIIINYYQHLSTSAVYAGDALTKCGTCLQLFWAMRRHRNLECWSVAVTRNWKKQTIFSKMYVALKLGMPKKWTGGVQWMSICVKRCRHSNFQLWCV